MSEAHFPSWHADPRLPTDAPFTTAEARRRGVSGSILARLANDGSLRRPFHGVYIDAALPDSVDIRASALALAVPEAAVVTDVTAAWLYGVDLYPSSGYWTSRPLHYVRRRECTRVRRPGVESGRRTFTDDDLRRVNGITVTTPLRTACDLVRSQRRADALAALDALLGLNEFTKDQLLGETERFRGQRGVVQFRDLAPLADGRSESVNESKLRLEWLDAGLPSPELQIPVVVASGRRYRLDIGDSRVRYAAEFDGQDFHSSAEQLGHDQLRREAIRDEWWIVDVFHNEDLYDWNTTRRLLNGYRRAEEWTDRRERMERRRGVTNLSTHREIGGFGDSSAL